MMRKGERTRHMIVEKAAPIFNRKGFSGTALADLMQATGLKKGGIYRHFSSKEELAAEAFDYAWAVVSASRLQAEAGCSGVECLKAMISAFASYPANQIPGGCPLLNTAVEADDTNALLRTRAKAALDQWILRIRQMVEQAIEEKQISAGTDPDDVTFILISALEGALMVSRLERDRAALERVKLHLLRFIEGLQRDGR